MSSGDVKIHSHRRSSPTQSDGKLNKISGQLTENPAQGGSQAMLYAVGLDEQTITNPQVGISPVWWEGVTYSDGMTMSTEGMRYVGNQNREASPKLTNRDLPVEFA
ncbi:unnamed protein product [Rhizoctonia solani]|nr:unnamed protein product [Rhizoctonia solani]